MDSVVRSGVPSADTCGTGRRGRPHGRDLSRRGRRTSGARGRDDLDTTAARCRCIEAVVAHAFRLSVDDLRAQSRCEAPIAFARQVAMYVAHVWLSLSLSEVGRRFDRDRTTVAHACRLVEDRRDDPRIDRIVTAIESAVEMWADLARRLEGEP